MSEINPYAAPADLATNPSLAPAGLYFSEGAFLVVRGGAELPEVCLITNQPLLQGAWRKKVQITWNPSWVFILILINIIVLVVVMLITQKKAKITYSLSADARGKILRRRNTGFVLLLVFVGALAYAIMQEGPGWISGVAGCTGAVSFITALVFFIIANPIKAMKHKEGWFRVKGCSKEFLDTLPRYPSPF